MGGVAEIMLYVTGEAAFHIIIFFFLSKPTFVKINAEDSPMINLRKLCFV